MEVPEKRRGGRERNRQHTNQLNVLQLVLDAAGDPVLVHVRVQELAKVLAADETVVVLVVALELLLDNLLLQGLHAGKSTHTHMRFHQRGMERNEEESQRDGKKRGVKIKRERD